jgi:hypothetical protein
MHESSTHSAEFNSLPSRAQACLGAPKFDAWMMFTTLHYKSIH